MRALLMLLAGVAAVRAGADEGAGAGAGARHAFYRDLRGGSGSGRRVFGGRSAALAEWGAVCALLDRYWRPRCSGAVLRPRWALTAAHCVTPRLAYVAYNTRRPRRADGDAAPVHYLYRHPGYRVEVRDEGRGPDVTLLHHDVGLVRTRADMALSSPPPVPPLDALTLYEPRRLTDRPVDVLGFGRTEAAAEGDELSATRLVLAECARGAAAWRHCVCGAGAGAGGERGVCAGDSGGPVVYRGALVALASMGPAECAGEGGEGGEVAARTSVLTALREYAPLLRAAVAESEAALRMARVSAAPRRRRRGYSLVVAAAAASVLQR